MAVSIATKRWKILRCKIQMSRRKFANDILAVIPKTWRTFVATHQACVSTHMDGSHMVTDIWNAKKKKEPTLTHLYCQRPIPFHVSAPDNTNVSWLPLQYPTVYWQPWLYPTDTARRCHGVPYRPGTWRRVVFACAFPVEGMLCMY